MTTHRYLAAALVVSGLSLAAPAAGQDRAYDWKEAGARIQGCPQEEHRKDFPLAGEPVRNVLRRIESLIGNGEGWHS